MKHLQIFIICLLFITAIKAQDFQGKAIYQSKFRLDMRVDSTQVSQTQQQQIQEMLRKQLEKNFELFFDKNRSIYREEARLEQETGGFGGMMIMVGGALNGKQFKDLKNKTFSKESELMGKNFLIKDSLTVFNWKLVNETKMIGNYLCFKAVATVKNPAMSLNFGRGGGGRNNQNQTENNTKVQAPPQDIIVEAWYSPEVPVNNGPAEYWGLPGLIMEVNADRMTLQLVKLEMNPKEKIQIKELDKGKVVTQKEYDDILKAKTEEMRQNFQGGQRGNTHSIQIRM
ncbi:MAG: GLPGLI family protein [Flavobacteriaceae bacterium]|jgi:GLPGLI family protein|nr:GLPGLI family protein [Flavobacteriaceae bacterium]